VGDTFFTVFHCFFTIFQHRSTYFHDRAVGQPSKKLCLLLINMFPFVPKKVDLALTRNLRFAPLSCVWHHSDNTEQKWKS
jgi:hypothetical protein